MPYGEASPYGQIPMFSAGETRFFPEVAIAQRSLLANTQKVHRPGPESPLHFDIRNI